MPKQHLVGANLCVRPLIKDKEKDKEERTYVFALYN